jgi:2-oxoisovalerate dehydrogenase E1 component beta subunit
MRAAFVQQQRSIAPLPRLLRRAFEWFPFSIGSRRNSTIEASFPAGETTNASSERMNLFTAVNHALHIALATNDDAICFGEDVAFGGVFRCTQHLQDRFGRDRVFNTPLSEVGIVGFAIGYAATSESAVAIGEIQFADYLFPALDQLVNELAKFRYRSGNQWHAGGVTLRTPYGSVGHGGHYHSQSPEAYLCHTAGLTVVTPRSPAQAKGLLLSAIRSPDPVVFLEPKALYRTAVEDVPLHDYELPLRQADVVQHGTDITLIGYGPQIRVLLDAAHQANQQHGISCEVLDLQTLLPWDVATVVQSVHRTGKCVVSHEAPLTCGLGAEVVATVQQECFWSLQAPVVRVCGYDTPFPLVHEAYYLPNATKVYAAIVHCMEQAK